MKRTIISVTEAARNFADCVNRAHYQDVTFVLVKNGKPVARLLPDGADPRPMQAKPKKEKICLGRDLAEVLRSVDLPASEAKAWRRDLQRGRRALKPPAERWR
jgi:prevent-host-death family protein